MLSRYISYSVFVVSVLKVSCGNHGIWNPAIDMKQWWCDDLIILVFLYSNRLSMDDGKK